MKDVYQEVTNAIIAQLEKGIIPWHKPWTGSAGGAISHTTGRAYSLLNQLMLKPGEYLTFNQCKAEGGFIKKGSKANIVVFWKIYKKEVSDENGQPVYDEEGNRKYRNLPVLKYYQVFHIDDCEGIQPKYPAKEIKEVDPANKAEQVFSSYIRRENIHLDRDCISDEAYYSPVLDSLHLPMFHQFDRMEEYYSTAFHEATHSTGHTSRLNRFTGAAAAAHFGSTEYSKEELTAEIGAACCLARCGISTDGTLKNSAAYIQSWLQALKNDKKMIVGAAARAEKAVNYIFGDTVSGKTPDPDTETASDETAAAPAAPAASDEKKPVKTASSKADYTKAQTAAFKRCFADEKIRPAYAGIMEYDGVSYICDGYRMLALAGKVSDELKRVETPATISSLIDKALKPAMNAAKSLIELPDLKALKLAVKLYRQQRTKKTDFPEIMFHFDGFDYVMNAQYLIDMMQAM